MSRAQGPRPEVRGRRHARMTSTSQASRCPAAAPPRHRPAAADAGGVPPEALDAVLAGSSSRCSLLALLLCLLLPADVGVPDVDRRERSSTAEQRAHRGRAQPQPEDQGAGRPEGPPARSSTRRPTAAKRREGRAVALLVAVGTASDVPERRGKTLAEATRRCATPASARRRLAAAPRPGGKIAARSPRRASRQGRQGRPHLPRRPEGGRRRRRRQAAAARTRAAAARPRRRRGRRRDQVPAIGGAAASYARRSATPGWSRRSSPCSPTSPPRARCSGRPARRAPRSRRAHGDRCSSRSASRRSRSTPTRTSSSSTGSTASRARSPRAPARGPTRPSARRRPASSTSPTGRSSSPRSTKPDAPPVR